jgi:hypothetical protein
MERFNPRKLSEVRGKEQYHVEVSNRFAALEDLDTEVDINSAWETIRLKSKFQLKRDIMKPRFDEGCLELLDQRKQAK